MTRKHTPGPWKHDPNDFWTIISSPKKKKPRVICKIHGWREKNAANAHLIAAAPDTADERDNLKAINAELLTILKQVLAEAGDTNNGTFLLPPTAEKVRAIITKAKETSK